MRRGLLYQCCSCNFPQVKMPSPELSGISTRFRVLFQSDRQIVHVLLTRPPLTPKGPLDLHVLGTPPAFVLSQDQTLNKCSCELRLTFVSRYFWRGVCLVFKEPLMATDPLRISSLLHLHDSVTYTSTFRSPFRLAPRTPRVSLSNRCVQDSFASHFSRSSSINIPQMLGCCHLEFSSSTCSISKE
jgi:hypothetical protein